MRSLGRLLALAWVITSSAAALLLRPTHRRNLRSRALWLQSTCRSALHALGVVGRFDGRPPATGAMIAANHLGYLDILVLAAATPVVFVAKREVQTWPVFGWFARMAGTRFIVRERRGDVARVAGEFAPVLAEGVSLLLFLEGTSTDGHTVRPFKASLLEPAIQGGWPVVPAAVGYALPPGYSVANEVCWWGDMTLAPHLFHLAGLPRIEARVAWGEAVRPASGRKVLAAILHEQVTRLSDRLRGFAVRPDASTAPALVPLPAQN